MSAPVLELIDLSAGYADIPIVYDFSVRLHAGSITTLIGGNGAGKSTLLRAIYGTNRRFSGRIVFAGEAIEELSPRRMSSTSRMRVGLTPATGSSRTTRAGRGIRAAASAKSFFCP